jgi:hypothetical protein
LDYRVSSFNRKRLEIRLSAATPIFMNSESFICELVCRVLKYAIAINGLIALHTIQNGKKYERNLNQNLFLFLVLREHVDREIHRFQSQLFTAGST